MEYIDLPEYDNICKDATVLRSGYEGEKVFALPGGNFLKLFRLKVFSSAFFYPYAQRFTDNIQILRQLGIPCPEVIRVARIGSRKMRYDAVFYRPLAGDSLRRWATSMTDTDNDEPLRAELGAFVANLHEGGIYFRSLHLGNIIRTPDDRFGLIDVSDLTVHAPFTPYFAHRFGLINIADLTGRSRPLPPSLAHRNFRHLLRWECDRSWLLADQGGAFHTAYCRVRGNSADYPQDMLTRIPPEKKRLGVKNA